MKPTTTAAPRISLARLLYFSHPALSLLFWITTSHAEEYETTKCFTESSGTQIETVSALGDLHLASGSIVYLSDISLPEAEPWRQQAFEKLKSFSNTQITVAHTRSKDRWQRHRAAISAGEKDIALSLIEAGLAIIDPGEAGRLCNKRLLTSEQEARKNRTGLWSDLTYHPVKAGQTSELLRQEGSFTLVTGRVLSIGIRKRWVYLNFGRDWNNDFTATLPIEVWKQLQAKQISEQNLKGKTVLLRGVIRHWKGPSMEISSPDSLETGDEKN